VSVKTGTIRNGMGLCVCVCLSVHPVPGSVVDLHVVTHTSKSVVLSWSAMDCRQRNGPSVGYTCELIQQSVHNSETSQNVETSHIDGAVVRHQVVNDTRLELSRLVPFTRYTFFVSFRNSEFDGPKTFVNFTTDEDGLSHTNIIHISEESIFIFAYFLIIIIITIIII